MPGNPFKFNGQPFIGRREARRNAEWSAGDQATLGWISPSVGFSDSPFGNADRADAHRSNPEAVKQSGPWR